jgi:GAF domain-containing protein
MRKIVPAILVVVSTAYLLFVSAGLNSSLLRQPQLYAITLWLSVFLSFAAFAVVLAEFLWHQRLIHLYLAATFLFLGVTGVWYASTFPLEVMSSKLGTVQWHHLALLKLQWLVFAVLFLCCLVGYRERDAKKRYDTTKSFLVLAIAVLLASLVVLVGSLPSVPQLLTTKGSHKLISILCSLMLLLATFIYTRPSVHRGNCILLWTSYGLIFAMLAQVAMAIGDQPSRSLLNFIGVMQVMFLLSPAVGMLAEHTRLELKLRNQAVDLNSLVDIQQTICSTVTPKELYNRIVELVASSLGCDAVCLMEFENERGLLRTTAQTGFNDEVAKQLVFRPSEGPPGDAFSERTTTFVRNLSEDPVLSGKLGNPSYNTAGIFIPLLSQNRCLGVLGVFFNGQLHRRISKDRMKLLEAFANQTAIAVENVKLRSRVIDSNKASDEYARELETMWEIGKAIASKLELHDLVDTLSNMLATVLGGTSCSVLVFDSNSASLKIIGHKRLNRYRSVADHIDQCDIVAAEVAKSGNPLIVNNVPNSPLCKYPDMAVDDGGFHHLLCVPMSLRGFVGAISVFRQNGPPFTEKEQDFLVRLSPMVAVGIRNADLYERERTIAQNLQQSMLPDLTKNYDDIQVAASHDVSLDESFVGGDFYDVIELGEGSYGISIGDVAGKGIDAAVYTAMARYMIRAYSTDDPDPMYVVSKLNTALCRYIPSGKFVTLIYGVLDTKSKTFRYVNAGQEIPFLYKHRNGVLEALLTTGPAAGALIDAKYTCEVVEFEPGDVFVFYTDGATEVKREGKFLETEGLKSIVLDKVKGEFEYLPQQILESIRSYGDKLRDDVAILAIKIRTPGVLF